MKRYISKSHISISVTDTDGNHAHISFTPLTLGGSVFYTSDEKLQAAIERHYKFGSLFWAEELDETPSRAAKEVSTVTDAAESTGEEAQDAEDTVEAAYSLKTVQVSDLGTAKDYLANTYGVSRTKLKTKASVIATAAANGIVFEGL